MNLHIALKKLFKKPHKTQADLARFMGWDRSAVTKLLNGKRELKAWEAEKVAAFFEIDLNTLYSLGGKKDSDFEAASPLLANLQEHQGSTFDGEVIHKKQLPIDNLYGNVLKLKIPVVGYIDVGQEVFAVSNHLGGGGFEMVESRDALKHLDPKVIKALRLKDNAIPPFTEGALIYYSAPLEPELLLNKYCVIKVVDGPTLVGYLRPGDEKGKYHLETGKNHYSKEVEWAAKVEDLVP